MTDRHATSILDAGSDICTEPLQVYLGGEVYHSDGPDTEHQIDMALLNGAPPVPTL